MKNKKLWIIVGIIVLVLLIIIGIILLNKKDNTKIEQIYLQLGFALVAYLFVIFSNKKAFYLHIVNRRLKLNYAYKGYFAVRASTRLRASSFTAASS